jgi:hypothetical protein
MQNWTAGGMLTNTNANVNQHIQFQNQMWMHLGFNYGNFGGGSFDDRLSRGGPAVRKSADFSFWAGVEGDYRKRVTPGLWWGGGRSDEGRSSYYYAEPQIDVRAKSNLTASLGMSFERNINDNQWYDNVVGGDGNLHHTFAHLDQTTMSVTTRVNYIFTPNLTLQFYGQPFVSTGRYSDVRELDDPTAKSFTGRYKPYATADEPSGFNFKQFQSNTVLRWEYRPGSTLFFVWAQGRDAFRDDRPEEFDFRFRRDAQDIFALHPRNTFLVKASYWFNP